MSYTVKDGYRTNPFGLLPFVASFVDSWPEFVSALSFHSWGLLPSVDLFLSKRLSIFCVGRCSLRFVRWWNVVCFHLFPAHSMNSIYQGSKFGFFFWDDEEVRGSTIGCIFPSPLVSPGLQSSARIPRSFICSCMITIPTVFLFTISSNLENQSFSPWIAVKMSALDTCSTQSSKVPAQIFFDQELLRGVSGRGSHQPGKIWSDSSSVTSPPFRLTSFLAIFSVLVCHIANYKLEMHWLRYVMLKEKLLFLFLGKIFLLSVYKAQKQ